MKVLVIMGSPRKGNTWTAVRRIEEHMQVLGGVTFEYLMLGDIDLSHCRGCYVCFEKGEEHCPLKDNAPAIEQQMHEADAVVFASPVYGMNVTGLMKTFIDRFAYIFHRPRFFDKKAFLVTTTGAIGHKEVLEYLDLVAGVWGFEVVGQVALITPPIVPIGRMVDKNEKTCEEAAVSFYHALHRERRPPALKDVFMFHGQRAAFGETGDVSPVDYAYWKEKGWLERGMKYYVDVPVNPLYHALGRIFEQYVRRQVRRGMADIG